MSCPQIWNIEKAKDRENEKVGNRLEKLNKKKSDKELDREFKNQRRRISLEEQRENFIPAVSKSEMLAALNVKMSGSEMKKGNRNTSNKIFCKHNDIFSTERVTWKFHVATTTAKKCTKKCAVTCKVVFLFLLIGRRNFFAVLVAVAVEHSTILFLV